MTRWLAIASSLPSSPAPSPLRRSKAHSPSNTAYAGLTEITVKDGKLTTSGIPRASGMTLKL